jgi:hypothetical protein
MNARNTLWPAVLWRLLPAAALLGTLFASPLAEARMPSGNSLSRDFARDVVAIRVGPAEILGIGLAGLGPSLGACPAIVPAVLDPGSSAPVPTEALENELAQGDEVWEALEMEWNVSGNPDPPPDPYYHQQ